MARHVLDRFHVIRWFAAGLTTGPLRRPTPPAWRHQTRVRARGVLSQSPLCCAEATPLLTPTRPPSKPSSTPTPGSDPAGRPSSSSHRPYTAEDHDGALDALGRFCDLYETGGLPEFHDTVDTFIAWSDQILAWHHTD